MKNILMLMLLPLITQAQCPVITQQPQSQADCEGNSIRMIVGSTGTQFQWERKRPTDNNFNSISGATQANYQIMPTGNTSHPSGTLYRVKISAGTCNVYSEAASITLRKIQSIINPSICERGNGKLMATHSEGARRFQWLRSIKGGPYEELTDDVNFSGSQQAQLSISNATNNLDGQKFRIRIDFSVSPNNDNEGSTTNQNNSLTCPRTSPEVTLQIKPSPIPRHAATLYSGCLNEGFSVNASGCSPYTTQWYDEQRNPIGTGARLLMNLSNQEEMRVFASCNNAGCESPLSTGTLAKAFPKPPAPTNTGTVAEICPGKTISFKASGGSNNIWYLDATSPSPLSTATNYLLLASGSSTITRYVSQKINGCESERTAISVQILGNNNCVPNDSTQILPPVVIPPIAPPEDTAQTKIPTAKLEYRILKNCDLAWYEVSVSGCPNSLHWWANQQYVQTGHFYSAYVPENTELHVECPGTISEALDIRLPGLNPPQIPLQTNYQQFICDGDKVYLSIQLPSGAQMIGWELNGHLFNQNPSLHEHLSTGNYQAVIQQNACTYRSETIYIEVRPRPNTPLLVGTKLELCEDDSTQIEIIPEHLHYRWRNETGIERNKMVRKTAGLYSFAAEVSDDGICWSASSQALNIRVHPTPVRPSIILEKTGGFCRGDSIRLQINQTGISYRWSTSDTLASIYVKQATTYQVQWQDANGCWSPKSLAVQTYYFPDEPQPRIQVYPNRQFCLGERVVIRASPAHAYLWNTHATSDSIIVQNSSRIYLTTRNAFGCWSPPSGIIEVVAQENPIMPVLKRSGVYFLQANAVGSNTKFEWRVNARVTQDSAQQIKIRQSGLYEVRSNVRYNLLDARAIECVSAYQKVTIGIPMEDPGIRIYPNPNKGQRILVEIQEDLNNLHVELYTLQGKIVKSWNIANTQSINYLELQDVFSGAYILTLVGKNWARRQRIFIVSD